MEALTNFDISKNELYAAGAKALVEALKGNQIMTELNMSSNYMGKTAWLQNGAADMSGIIALADAIPGMGAMTKLSVANNMLAAQSNAKAAGEALGEMLRGNVILKELDVSGNAPVGYSTDGPSFAAGISQGLSDNGAMTSLNLASNYLGAEGAKIVAEVIKVTKCTPAIILAPFSCPSDFSINCCCLLLSPGHGGTVGIVFEREQSLCCWCQGSG